MLFGVVVGYNVLRVLSFFVRPLAPVAGYAMQVPFLGLWLLTRVIAPDGRVVAPFLAAVAAR